MTTRQLREWLFTNSKSDQWWVSINNETSSNPLSTYEIEDLMKNQPTSRISVLHTSQIDIPHPPWVELDHKTSTLKANRRKEHEFGEITSAFGAAPAPAPAPAPNQNTSGLKNHEEQEGDELEDPLGTTLVAFPIIMTAVLIALIFFMGRESVRFTGYIHIATLLITAYVISADALHFGMGTESDVNEKGKRRTKPWIFVWFSIGFWPLIYPFYMLRRTGYGGRKSTAIAGTAVCIIHTVVWHFHRADMGMSATPL